MDVVLSKHIVMTPASQAITKTTWQQLFVVPLIQCEVFCASGIALHITLLKLLPQSYQPSLAIILWLCEF